MKHTKKLFFSVALSLIMLFAYALFPCGITTQNAKAYGNIQDIYYLYDLYPSVDAQTLEREFNGYNIVYDGQTNLNEQKFAKLLQKDDYQSLSDTVVIVDIKTFIPDFSLTDWFSWLENNGCITAFITTYSREEMTAAGLDYADIFLPDDDFESLRNFFDAAISKQPSPENACYLLDFKMLGNNYPLGDPENLFSDSPCLAVFMRTLVDKLTENGSFTYEECVSALTSDDLKVKVLVSVTYYHFIDLLGDLNDPIFYDYLEDINAPNSSRPSGCSFGFWEYMPDFWEYSATMQSQKKKTYNIHVYESEPIPYNPNGPVIQTNRTLECSALDDTTQELLEALHYFL